jgi:NAD(P)-dependent dehydrogenase (short-subunit alcohol dehydrogenase family)
MNDLFGLAGKRALVVGGGRGMGESSARLLAQVGADVAVLDVDRDRAEHVAAAVREIGRRGEAVVANILDDAGAAGGVAEAERRLGGLDVLVTIVGQALFTPLIDMNGDQWDSEQRRNLRYFFVVGSAVARSMIRSGSKGAMCCIASVDGVQSAPFHGAYGAAKAGLIHLVSTMATEWAEHGIRVNAVAPGSISTPRLPDTAEGREVMRNSLVPMARSGTTDEIGKAVLFLVSDMASYITGHTLLVDGGWMAANLFDARRFKIKNTIERSQTN